MEKPKPYLSPKNRIPVFYKYQKDVKRHIKLISEKEKDILYQKIKEGDSDAEYEFIEANLPLVMDIAKKYQDLGLGIADIVAEGNQGLIFAVKHYDKNIGKFSSYAQKCIEGYIKKALSKNHTIQIPRQSRALLKDISDASKALERDLQREPTSNEVAKHLNLSLEKVLKAQQFPHEKIPFDPASLERNVPELSLEPDHFLMTKSLKKEINRLLNSTILNEREREIVKLYFGIDVEKELTLDEISQKYGITRERARQIKEKAIRRLRHSSGNHLLEEYNEGYIPPHEKEKNSFQSPVLNKIEQENIPESTVVNQAINISAKPISNKTENAQEKMIPAMIFPTIPNVVDADSLFHVSSKQASIPKRNFFRKILDFFRF